MLFLHMESLSESDFIYCMMSLFSVIYTLVIKKKEKKRQEEKKKMRRGGKGKGREERRGEERRQLLIHLKILRNKVI